MVRHPRNTRRSPARALPLLQPLESRILMDGATAMAPLLRRSIAPDVNWTLHGTRLVGAVPSAAATPLAAPTNLNGIAVNASTVRLSWNYPGAPTAFAVFASADGAPLARIGQTFNGSSRSINVLGLSSGTRYTFAVQALSYGRASGNSNTTSITTALAAPSLSGSALSPTSVSLKWTTNTKGLTGFTLLRSADGTTFTPLVTLAGTTKSYTDATVSPFTTYSYRILALKNDLQSAASNTVSITTPLAAPTGLSATAGDTAIALAWTASPSAAAYNIFRSTDGFSFSKIASSVTNDYTDTPASAGTYYYKVQAYYGIYTSAYSTTASATLSAPSPTPTPSPTPAPSNGNVTISTRYTNELVVTAAGTSDIVLVAQSGSILTITADGTASTYALPAGGLFLYARGSSASFTIDASVTIRTVIAAIDNAATTVASAGSNVSAWLDSTDSFSGTGVLHAVASYAAGVSKAAGAALANPSDAGTTKKVALSLFGLGPVATDVNQGSVGDCYFLSSLAAFAGVDKARMLESAADLGDGTFVVQFLSSSAKTFVRVSNDFTTGYFNGGLKYAHPGANNTIWAMVMEKAFCYFRTGANTYNSINSGWMGEVYSDFGVSSSTMSIASYSDATLYTKFSTALASGKPVTLGTPSSGSILVGSHAYTLISVSKDASGNSLYTVRNPWGSSGDAYENASGYATLTYAQLLAAFNYGCLAI